jgi:hypothetical protein
VRVQWYAPAEMHVFAVALIPFYRFHASIRPLAARDAAALARLDTLMFRYEQPQEEAWGVDHGRGFMFDSWRVGGRWNSWGRDLRTLTRRQHLRPLPRPIPRCLERNAVWSEDLGRVRLTSSLFPPAVVTPHGEWEECSVDLPGFGKPTVRERKAKAAWLRRIRKLMQTYPSCLAIGVDCHC